MFPLSKGAGTTCLLSLSLAKTTLFKLLSKPTSRALRDHDDAGWWGLLNDAYRLGDRHWGWKPRTFVSELNHPLLPLPYTVYPALILSPKTTPVPPWGAAIFVGRQRICF